MERRSAADRRLLERYARDRDAATREALVARFMPLARQLAHRYVRGSEPLDDLVQVAAFGLLKAIDRYDPVRTSAFTSFAVPTILGELRRHFRDNCWAVRVPRQLQELSLRLERVSDDLARESARAPTTAEIAREIGTTAELVLEARAAANGHHAVSLDGPRDDEPESDTIGDALGSEDPGFDHAEDAATLDRLMTVLSARDREVLRLRFHEDLTQSEIGTRVGVSQMHVSRIIHQALARLRSGADPHGSISHAPL